MNVPWKIRLAARDDIARIIALQSRAARQHGSDDAVWRDTDTRDCLTAIDRKLVLLITHNASTLGLLIATNKGSTLCLAQAWFEPELRSEALAALIPSALNSAAICTGSSFEYIAPTAVVIIGSQHLTDLGYRPIADGVWQRNCGYSTLAPILAYNETSLPGSTLEERLHNAKRHGLALEIAQRSFPHDLPLSTIESWEIPIATVQAYEMHEFHPLHIEPKHRLRAREVVLDTLDTAARLGAPRIVTVCGFGQQLADEVMLRARDFFGDLIDRARALEMVIMIEPLGPSRARAFNTPAQVLELLSLLQAPDVFRFMIDTGHVLDFGKDLEETFDALDVEIEEIQLKGKGSIAPPCDWPVSEWLASLIAPPRVLCVEHNDAITQSDFEKLVGALRECLG